VTGDRPDSREAEPRAAGWVRPRGCACRPVGWCRRRWRPAGGRENRRSWHTPANVLFRFPDPERTPSTCHTTAKPVPVRAGTRAPRTGDSTFSN